MPGQLESVVVRGDYAGNSGFTCSGKEIPFGQISENIDTIDCERDSGQVKHLVVESGIR